MCKTSCWEYDLWFCSFGGDSVSVCWPTSIQFYIMQPHKQVVNNYFRLLRCVRGRNRFQTLHFKDTVVPVFIPLFGEHDSCGKSITQQDHTHIMKCNATLGVCQALLTGMSLLVFPVCMPSTPWYLFHLHTLLFLIFSSSKVCAPSRVVKRCARLDLCWRASLCALDVPTVKVDLSLSLSINMEIMKTWFPSVAIQFFRFNSILVLALKS